nr:response regulator [Pseudodesulfovibrio sp.]
MRFLIFENRVADIRGALEGLKLFVYKDLDWDFHVKSQDFPILLDVLEYDMVLVDLDLAKGSELDGYSLVEQILMLENHPPILIITGSYDVDDQLKVRDMAHVPYLIKPFDFKELQRAIKKARKICFGEQVD